MRNIIEPSSELTWLATGDGVALYCDPPGIPCRAYRRADTPVSTVRAVIADAHGVAPIAIRLGEWRPTDDPGSTYASVADVGIASAADSDNNSPLPAVAGAEE